MEEPAEFRRFIILEDVRKTSEACYAEDPFDTDNLTKWGSVLLQLSHFQEEEDMKKMIEDAISKLTEALMINPLNHETLWLLGNCFANQALMECDLNKINRYKAKASASYQKALVVDPGNETYIRSLEIFTKAPEMEKDIHTNAKMDKEIHPNGNMYKDTLTKGEMTEEIHTDAEIDEDNHTHLETEDDIHTHGFDQQFIGDASFEAKVSKKSDLKKYVIFGWILLAVGIVAQAGMATSNYLPKS